MGFGPGLSTNPFSHCGILAGTITVVVQHWTRYESRMGTKSEESFILLTMSPLNVVEVRTDVEGQRRLFDTRFSVRPEPETELAATGHAN